MTNLDLFGYTPEEIIPPLDPTRTNEILSGFGVSTVYVKNWMEALDALEDLQQQSGVIGVDIETAEREGYRTPKPEPRYDDYGFLAKKQPIWKPKNGLRPTTAYMRLLQLYRGGDKCYVFDMSRMPETIWGSLKSLLEDNELIAHNAIFETNFLLHSGIVPKKIGCTMILGSLIYRDNMSLRDLSSITLGVELDKSAQISDWNDDPLSEAQLAYAALDSVLAREIFYTILPMLREDKLFKASRQMHKGVVPTSWMITSGIGFDVETHNQMVAEWEKEHAKHAKEFERLTGIPDPAQNSVVRDWLKKRLTQSDLENFPLTDKGSLSLEADVLARYDYPELKPLANWKKVEKLLTTYGHTYSAHVDPITGRIHASYMVGGAGTSGRFSCREPNVQNPPRGKDFRDLFKASPGYKLVVADYSQIELRIAAYISGDETMLRAYAEGKDLHRLTAAMIMNVPEKEVSKEQRQLAKAVNFGLCIAEGEEVLTDFGLIPIENVQPYHRVWDGNSWVRHDGVVFKGYKRVINYDGLRATPDHKVWTHEEGKVSFGYAASKGLGLVQTGGEDHATPVRYIDVPSRNNPKGGAVQKNRRDLFGVQENEDVLRGQYHSEAISTMLLPTASEVFRSTVRDLGAALRFYCSALRERYTRFVTQLSRAWNQKSIQESRAFYPLGFENVPEYGFYRSGFRQDRQQRPLSPGQSSACNPKRESEEQIAVYDIVNAGPNHRFTCSGVLVSNCYGMGANTLVVYAQDSYGVDMTLEEAETYRERFFKTYPALRKWHRRQAEISEKQGYAETLCGRKVFWRWFNGEFKFTVSVNAPVQGTGAEVLIEAMWELFLEFYGTDTSLVAVVHDEVVMETPEDQADKTAGKVEDCMVRAYQTLLPDASTLDLVEAGSGSAWGSAKK